MVNMIIVVHNVVDVDNGRGVQPGQRGTQKYVGGANIDYGPDT